MRLPSTGTSWSHPWWLTDKNRLSVLTIKCTCLLYHHIKCADIKVLSLIYKSIQCDFGSVNVIFHLQYQFFFGYEGDCQRINAVNCPCAWYIIKNINSYIMNGRSRYFNALSISHERWRNVNTAQCTCVSTGKVKVTQHLTLHYLPCGLLTYTRYTRLG